MNATASLLTTTASEESKPVKLSMAERFCRNAVLDAFSRMTVGHLEMTLPDGTIHTFGTERDLAPARVRVQNERFFSRCVKAGDIGFGEAFVDEDWDTDDIAKVIGWFLLNVANSPTLSGSQKSSWKLNLFRFANRLRHLLRRNSKDGSRENIHEHYDLGNQFYRLWLDQTMSYSSAIFEDEDQSMESAQFAKYDALCQQLNLTTESHILEIGCGWGGFAQHAVTNYGCRVTAVTISQEQHDFAKQRFEGAGISDWIDLQLCDYRDIQGTYDRIVSIEMLEAVGDEFYDGFFRKCQSLLKPDGLMALQYITCPDSRFKEFKHGVDWIQKHIFPGSLLPSISRVGESMSRTGELFLHNLRDIGNSYARTLKIWRNEFNARLDEVKELGFDHEFIRKWNYYLAYCEAAFAMRNISVVQAVYTRPNNRSLFAE
jgi:cyclopropane-fatty-acyl-phospholipid synthase